MQFNTAAGIGISNPINAEINYSWQKKMSMQAFYFPI